MTDYDTDPFFSMYAEPNKKNSRIIIATLTQGSLGLPERDFYFRQDNESIQIKEQYLVHVTKMFIFLGDSPEIAESNARTVMKIRDQFMPGAKAWSFSRLILLYVLTSSWSARHS